MDAVAAFSPVIDGAVRRPGCLAWWLRGREAHMERSSSAGIAARLTQFACCRLLGASKGMQPSAPVGIARPCDTATGIMGQFPAIGGQLGVL